MTVTPLRRARFRPTTSTDIGLAADGVRRIEWAEREMPVLRLIRERFEQEQPLEGLRVGACLHVTTRDRQPDAHAQGRWRGRRAVRVQPAVHAGRCRRGAGGRVRDPTYARRGVDRDGYYRPPQRGRRHASADDHGRRLRPRLAAPQGAPRPGAPRSSPAPRRRPPASSACAPWPPTARCAIPVVAVNEAKTKHLFDNRYGTGQSTVDGILRATNILLAGRHVVVAGYGWVGQGIASRMRGMGAHGRHRRGRSDCARIEALMDGFQVMPAIEAAPWGDLFVTATGNFNVFREEHFERHEGRRDHGQQRPLRRRAGPGRAGARWPAASAARSGRDVQEYDLRSKQALRPRRGPAGQPGRRRRPPGRGHGHELRQPGAVAEYVAKHHAELAKQVYVVPDEIDREVARLKLEALGIEIDTMTPEQVAYAKSWQSGT